MSSYADLIQSPGDRPGFSYSRRITFADHRLEADRRQGEMIADLILGIGRAIGAAANWARRSVASWASYRRTHAELSALDARMLADIGITQGEIERIARGQLVDDSRARPSATPSPPRSPANQNKAPRAA